ncbi:MAG: hypothetical protein ABI619_12220, partial [Betaproteobacteria bacterium]
GLWLILEQRFSRTRHEGESKPIYQTLLAWLSTNAVVFIAWIFFRAESVEEAWYILTHLPQLGPLSYGTFKLLNLPSFEILLLGYQLATLFVVDFCWAQRPAWAMRLWAQRWFRWAAMLYLFYTIALFGVFGKIEFIYFQF